MVEQQQNWSIKTYQIKTQCRHFTSRIWQECESGGLTCSGNAQLGSLHLNWGTWVHLVIVNIHLSIHPSSILPPALRAAGGEVVVAGYWSQYPSCLNDEGGVTPCRSRSFITGPRTHTHTRQNNPHTYQGTILSWQHLTCSAVKMVRQLTGGSANIRIPFQRGCSTKILSSTEAVVVFTLRARVLWSRDAQYPRASICARMAAFGLQRRCDCEIAGASWTKIKCNHDHSF